MRPSAPVGRQGRAHQPSLFDPAPDSSTVRAPEVIARAAQPDLTARHAPRTPRRSAAKTPVERPPSCVALTVSDMPRYPSDIVEDIQKTIASIPCDRMFFTYREIQRYFGISRATVCRRMSDGLLPGIRVENGAVLPDGPVRRFDRQQVLYLVLAVRHGRNRV